MSFTEIGHQGVRLGWGHGRAIRTAHGSNASLIHHVCSSSLAEFENSGSQFGCCRPTKNSTRVRRTYRPSCYTSSVGLHTGNMFRIGSVPTKEPLSRGIALSPVTLGLPLAPRQGRKDARALAGNSSNGHSAESRGDLSIRDYIKGMHSPHRPALSKGVHHGITCPSSSRATA